MTMVVVGVALRHFVVVFAAIGSGLSSVAQWCSIARGVQVRVWRVTTSTPTRFI